MPALLFSNASAANIHGTEGQWNACDINAIQQAIKQPDDPGRESFYPSLWGRAHTLDRRLKRLLERGDLEALAEDEDLRAWLAIRRALVSRPVPQASSAQMVCHDGVATVRWAPGEEKSISPELAQVMELEEGEATIVHFFQLPSTAGRFAGERIILGLGIPAKVRQTLNIRHLDFLPVQPGAYRKDLAPLWQAAARTVDFIQEDGTLVPWGDSGPQKVRHLKDLVRALGREDELAALTQALKGQLPSWTSLGQGNSSPLDRIPYLRIGDRKVYLRTTGEQGPAVIWDGPAPSPTGATFLGGEQHGDRIVVGDQQIPAEWVSLSALFAHQALDFHLEDGSKSRHPRPEILGHAFRNYLPVSPMAVSLLEPGRLKAWARDFNPSEDGQSMVLPVQLPAREDDEGQEQDLPLSFRIAYRRLDVPSDQPSATFPMAGSQGEARRAAMALGLFPRFTSPKWKHYFLHVARWEQLAEIQVDAHAALEDKAERLPVSEDGPVFHHLKFRPSCFGLSRKGHALGVILADLPDERLDSAHGLKLAIDLGSANTTLAARWAELDEEGLVDMDIRKLYDQGLLVEYQAGRAELQPLHVGIKNEADLRKDLETHWACAPRRLTFGIPHLRAQRYDGITGTHEAVLAGSRQSPWFARSANLDLLKSDDDRRYESLPTQAACQVPLTEPHADFKTLFPVLERDVEGHPDVQRAILGHPLRDGAKWNLVQDLKWGGDEDNRKATYLAELIVLACASISAKSPKVVDMDKVQLSLTYPFGQRERILQSIERELTFKDRIQATVSESEANLRYLDSQDNAVRARDTSHYTLIMDMGGSTTDFSLVHQGELKAYASLGQFTRTRRRRFFGGLALVDMLAEMPAGGGAPRGADSNGIRVFNVLNGGKLTGPSRDLAEHKGKIAALIHGRMPELQLDSQDLRIKLHLMAYAVCHFGAQLVLHHVARMEPRPDHIQIQIWLPGSGWKLMRLATDQSDSRWTENNQRNIVKRMFRLAFEEARRMGGFQGLTYECPDQRVQIPNHRHVAKASVVLGALKEPLNIPTHNQSVPFGISLAPARGQGAGSAFQAWRPDGPDGERAVADWLQASEDAGLGDGAAAWQDLDAIWERMAHPFRSFGDPRELERLGQELFADAALERRFLEVRDGQKEIRFVSLLKEAHKAAVQELREAIRNPQVLKDLGSPLAFYLEALNEHLFQPHTNVHDRLGRDQWDPAVARV